MNFKKMAVLAGGATLGYFIGKKGLKEDFCPKCAVNKVISAYTTNGLE